MSKKQKRRKVRGGDRHNEIATPMLETRARAALEAQRWRDAIAAFKALLKREQRSDWRADLASAYAGRAAELTEKGMLKEALAIWENRTALNPDAPLVAGHAALLVRLAPPEAVLDLLGADALPPAQRDAVRAQLAARVLAGDRALLERLPADEPVRRHAKAALNALAAYCDHDDAALRATLAEIPFRSPYRDWVQILKALLLCTEVPGEAQALLERVDDTSAFAPVKRAAELSLLPDGAFLSAAASAGATAVRTACVLRGWPPARIALWEDLRRLGSEPPPLALLRLLHRHQPMLGADWVRRQSLRLVAHGHNGGAIDWPREASDSHPSPFEQALLAAWTIEAQHDPWLLLERWQRCADLLKRRWQETQDPDLALRIALLLRRGDAQGDLLGPPTAPSGDPHYFDTIAAAQLERSLSWDPDHRPTFLRLIGYYRRGRQLKDARRVLAQAQSRWPEDMALLEAALDIALDAGSFKKATGLARRMLDLDPINTGVRRRLVDAHLAHARKQVAKARTDLARTELAAAAQWARDEQAQASIALTTALLAVIDDDAAGIQALREQTKAQGATLAERLELMLAANALGVPLGKVNTRLKLKPAKVRDRADLVAAMGRLRGAWEAAQTQTLSAETLGALDATLLKAPWRSLSHAELVAACDTLQRCQLDKARLQAAKAALKRWRGEPVFELHRFEAKYPEGFDFRAMKDLFDLEAALDRARLDGDMRTALRIEQALPAFGADGGPGGGPACFPPVPFPFEADFEESEAVPEDFIELIRTLGLTKVLEMVGAPAELIRQAKDIERDLGADAAKELLLQFLANGEIDPVADLPPPTPRPRPQRGGRRKSRDASDGGADDDGDMPKQLNLF